MNEIIQMGPPGGRLEYNGVAITQQGDRLNLTDMWRAVGSPSGRGPSDWLALGTTKQFVACVEASFNAGKPGIEAKRGGRGANRGSTSAHWQIGLAYAKYLSPEFHMWCNTVVRQHMEGKAAAPLAAVDPAAMQAAIEASVAQVMQRLTAPVIERIALLENRLDFVVDPDAVVAREFSPMLDELKARQVPPKRRGHLCRQMARRANLWLTARCTHGNDVRYSRRDQKLLFRRAALLEWMDAEGKAMLRAHMDRLHGQTVIAFPTKDGFDRRP